MFMQYNQKWRTINNMDLMKYEMICTTLNFNTHVVALAFALQMLMYICAKPFQRIKCASQCVFIYTRFNTCSNRMPLRLHPMIDDEF